MVLRVLTPALRQNECSQQLFAEPAVVPGWRLHFLNPSKKMETRLTGSVPKQDPNRQKVKLKRVPSFGATPFFQVGKPSAYSVSITGAGLSASVQHYTLYTRRKLDIIMNHR